MALLLGGPFLAYLSCAGRDKFGYNLLKSSFIQRAVSAVYNAGRNSVRLCKAAWKRVIADDLGVIAVKMNFIGVVKILFIAPF